MNLHTLHTNSRSPITDNGIKHMNLHTLYANDNDNITDDGIQHMDLKFLVLRFITITDKCKKMLREKGCTISELP